MNDDRVLRDIVDELGRARSKFPTWPDDPLHAAAVVNEEAGELTRAVLKWVYEGGNAEDVKREAVQTAAMAVRFLVNISLYETYESGQIRDEGEVLNGACDGHD